MQSPTPGTSARPSQYAQTTEAAPAERPSRLASAAPLDSERMRQNVLKKFQQRILALQRLESVPTFTGRLSACPLVDSAAGRCVPSVH